MLRTYKFNGKMWRFEEGEQPESAVLAESAVKGELAHSTITVCAREGMREIYSLRTAVFIKEAAA